LTPVTGRGPELSSLVPGKGFLTYKERGFMKRSKTNWTKLRRIKDSEIDLSDNPELGEEFFKRAVVRLPPKKVSVSIRLDEKVLAWFKKQGKGYQTRINEILKMYMKAKAA
jgi:uncharacterized protein (DUF4415 family)